LTGSRLVGYCADCSIDQFSARTFRRLRARPPKRADAAGPSARRQAQGDSLM